MYSSLNREFLLTPCFLYKSFCIFSAMSLGNTESSRFSCKRRCWYNFVQFDLPLTFTYNFDTKNWNSKKNGSYIVTSSWKESPYTTEIDLIHTIIVATWNVTVVYYSVYKSVFTNLAFSLSTLKRVATPSSIFWKAKLIWWLIRICTNPQSMKMVSIIRYEERACKIK